MMKKSEISRLIRPNIRALKCYGAKEIRCKVKLDANESPFSPLPVSKLSTGRKLLLAFNRYPDPEGKALKNVISKNLGVPPKNILLGNGSDEIIYYLITTIGGPVLFPIPTFVMYDIISRGLGEKALPVPLDENFDLDVKTVLAAIKKEKPKLIFLSSPNNPTGNCFSSDRILKIIKASKGIVVVDEAYLPFADNEGFLPLLNDYPNLVIMKTLSKIGFAALRVGFMIADETLISEIEKVRLPYNVNVLSQYIATMGLKNLRLVDARVREIKSERDRIMQELSSIADVRTYPSDANFIMFRVPDSGAVFNGLLKHGILIKDLNKVIQNAMRVTVGTRKENDLFISALKKVFREIKREAK
jgi:histidinol-phosphate aminotransferase